MLFPLVHAPRALVPTILAICISAALMPAEPVHAQEVARPQSIARPYAIPAQPLVEAVQQWGRIAGVQVYIDGAQGRGPTSSVVVGQYTDEEALRQLLAGTGLVARRVGDGAVSLEKLAVAPQASNRAADGAIVTDSLNVAGARRDSATGAARDIRGYDDVYDLDISTAYIGRAEVERYKGATPSDLLNGVPGVLSGDARNSGALDVNIRGIQGPGRVPVTIDGTEQALTVWRGYNGSTNRNYIDPFLIGGIQIIKGPSLVRNVRTGVGGAVAVKTLDVDDIVPEGDSFGSEFKVEGSSNSVAPRLPTLLTGQDYRDVPGFPSIPASPYTDPTLRVDLKSRDSGLNVFDGEDYAYRMAFGWKSDTLDLMGAYAYRERGNYFSGEHNASYYSQDIANAAIEDYITTQGNYFRPGNEVPNTSSQMESWLFKATWRPTNDQALKFGYRDSLSHYGEIMPSRIEGTDDRGEIQWPLSRVGAQAYNLEYKWQPEGSRWIDLYANLWRTDTVSDTYTAGGFPNYAQNASNPILKNTAVANAANARNGITLSNKINFTDSLDLTIGGNFQHEKLRSDDEYFGVSDGWRVYPRAGRREEREGNFNFQWRPVDFLTLNAGMRYSSYWAFDDFAAAHEGQLSASWSVREASYYTRTPEEVAAKEQYFTGLYQLFVDLGFFTPEQVAALVANQMSSYVGERHTEEWNPGPDGKYRRADNICVNGFMESVEYLEIVGGNAACVVGNGQASLSEVITAEKHRDHGWTPNFAATVSFSDHTRAYLSYNETLRYPSMFESTIGFIGGYNPFYSLQPEHAYNWEAAYVHDLSGPLRDGSVADVKLSYYVHKTRDVIERGSNLLFSQLDKQTIRGVEFNARYDNGRFFTDLAVARTLENEVCDESTAIRADPTYGKVPNCVQDGFVGGYLITQAIPQLSSTWSLGGRFLDNRLEAGGRVVYYQRHKNPDLDWYRDYKEEVVSLAYYNVPFSWDRILILDAYLSYRLSDRYEVDLVGTNLTDQYYMDPATRSTMPAPGRALKLSFTARF